MLILWNINLRYIIPDIPTIFYNEKKRLKTSMIFILE